MLELTAEQHPLSNLLAEADALEITVAIQASEGVIIRPVLLEQESINVIKDMVRSAYATGLRIGEAKHAG